MKKNSFTKQYLKDNSSINQKGCWIWSGYCNEDGYAQRKKGGVTHRMHRVSYYLHNGSIPKGMCVLHSCDTPSCVNPKHLFIGTHSDNMKDMWSKGRHPISHSKHMARLTVQQVREIKKLKGSISGLALSRMYSVNDQSIRNIWNGVTWKNI